MKKTPTNPVGISLKTFLGSKRLENINFLGGNIKGEVMKTTLGDKGPCLFHTKVSWT